MTEENRIGPCDVCGKPARGPLCEGCGMAGLDAEGVMKLFAGLEVPEPTEFEARRLARLSPEAMFMVGVMIESWGRSGAPVTFSEAINQVEEAEGRIERRQGRS